MTRSRSTFEFDRKYKVPADAKAAVVAPSLVSDRYVQLLPAYTAGPVLRDDAQIGLDRTAVPVELDRISSSLDDLLVALGPTGANKDGAFADVLDTGAKNLDGQGQKLHDTNRDLSKALETLSGGRNDLFGTVKNLQVFTTMLATNDAQVRRLNSDLASVSEQLDGERDDLAAALKNLAVALSEVSSFVHDNRAGLTTNLKQLARVTGTVAEQRDALAETLTNAPVAISNLQNAYNPETGTLDTRANINENLKLQNLLCSLIVEGGQPASLCKTVNGVLKPIEDLLDQLEELGVKLPLDLLSRPAEHAGRDGTAPTADRPRCGCAAPTPPSVDCWRGPDEQPRPARPAAAYAAGRRSPSAVAVAALVRDRVPGRLRPAAARRRRATAATSIRVTAEFADVLDLVPQSSVKVDQVTVGSVEKIELNGWTARVTLRLPKNVELPDNAVAELKQTSLLGEKYVAARAARPDAARGPPGRRRQHPPRPHRPQPRGRGGPERAVAAAQRWWRGPAQGDRDRAQQRPARQPGADQGPHQAARHLRRRAGRPEGRDRPGHRQHRQARRQAGGAEGRHRAALEALPAGLKVLADQRQQLVADAPGPEPARRGRHPGDPAEQGRHRRQPQGTRSRSWPS